MATPVGPPVASKELLEWLEKTYPVRNPSLEESERVIFYHAGMVDLIKTLRHHFNRTNQPTHVTGG